ncbi:hypothetical protein MIMGU_mgv1a001403mg [Erythranthe guttata]|uniref:PHD-type domain-containing protein n=1 Tax=Erythranthe guttata TaxID=4155 RepID=A0A022QCE1_ERYGU|nr:hypothetical protein MIMGU_mgv1a001403mg [Erythranthe guttata]
MRETRSGESSTMIFSRVFEDLHDDNFEGSVDHQKIFGEVFFGSDGSSKRGCFVSETTEVDHNYTKQTDAYLCSNSGKSSLTSQADYAKEDFAGKHPLGYPCGDFTSSIISNHEVKLSFGDLPDVKPDLKDTLFASSSGVMSGISQENFGSAFNSLIYRVVESSTHGITSSSYQLKPLLYGDKRCQTSGRGSPNNRVFSLDQNDQKEATNVAVTSPISQESYASRLQVIDPPVSVAKNLEIHRPTKPKWKDACFVKLDEEEFAMPRDIKNDPRPLLRYHVNRLLRSAGWVIGRRRRNSKYNGIGEYVYKSPGGRPIREFHRAWCMCGESLLTDSISFMQTSDYVECAAKYQKISRSERIPVNSRPRQEWECNDTNQIGVGLFDVPISAGATQLLGGPEAVFRHQNSSTSSPSFDQAKIEAECDFGHNTKAYKKSRKISEMKLSGSHFGTRGDCSMSKISKARYGSKKSKVCGLNDDDLLISAIMKTKTCRTTKKWSTRKSKPLRKRKTPKGSCRLLPRNVKKGANYMTEGNWSAVGSRTVLSWLIHSGVISLNEVIQYRNQKDDAVIKDGVVTKDGILCKCCGNVLSISEFKSHAGFRLNGPCTNLFMESGKPFTLCQLEAWSTEYKTRKEAPQTDQVDELDQNDDSCGRCGDVGELICCDNCPSAFHQACLFEQELPEGNWYCPQCRCQICEDAVNDKETPQLRGALKCSQCEHKYHETCMQEKDMKVAFDSDTWLCGDSCHKIYTGLQSCIGLRNLLSDGFSWTLLRCIPGDQKVQSLQRVVALMAECNSKLAVAITIMEECFLPMVDMKTGIDMIPQVMYNWR